MLHYTANRAFLHTGPNLEAAARNMDALQPSCVQRSHPGCCTCLLYLQFCLRADVLVALGITVRRLAAATSLTGSAQARVLIQRPRPTQHERIQPSRPPPLHSCPAAPSRGAAATACTGARSCCPHP